MGVALDVLALPRYPLCLFFLGMLAVAGKARAWLARNGRHDEAETHLATAGRRGPIRSKPWRRFDRVWRPAKKVNLFALLDSRLVGVLSLGVFARSVFSNGAAIKRDLQLCRGSVFGRRLPCL